MSAILQAPTTERDERGVEWLVYEDIPVFDEHKGEDGVEYTKELLEAIADNNNRRIKDTDDYCPVVEGHTSDDDDPSKEPAIVGLAGPFKVKRFGKVNKRWAVYARFRIRPDKKQVFERDRPRRSVEIWPEDKPENRYFDPIALLGAKTPKRDLGLTHYSREGKAGKPYLYCCGMASPGGTNTFTPSTGDDDTPQRFAMGSGGDNADLIRQIIEALRPIIQSEVAEAFAAVQPETLQPTGDPMGDMGTPDMASPMGDQPDMNAMGAPDMSAPPSGGTDMGAPAEPMPGGEDPGGSRPMPMAKGGDEPPEAPEDDDESGKQLAKKFEKRFADVNSADAKSYLAVLDPKDRALVIRYAKSVSTAPSAPSKEKPVTTTAVEHDLPTRYAKQVQENTQLKQRYQKLAEENATLKDQLAAANKASRYSKRREDLLTQQASGVILDIEDELQSFGDVDDAAWDKHVTLVATRYAKVPMGAIEGLEAAIADATPPARPENTEVPKAERYSKSAQKETLRLRSQGKRVNYDAVLKHMIDNNTDQYPG